MGVLAVIFVLTLATGGVLVWQKVIVLPIQPNPTPDLTINWKLYTSENLKFTVKYPPNFYLDQDLLTSYSINEAKKGNLPTVNYLKCNFLSYDPELFNVKSQTVLREGPPLIELLAAKDKSLPIDSDTGLFNLYRISQSSKPRIGFLCVSEGSAQDQIINQILSTFKFIDQNNVSGTMCGGWDTSGQIICGCSSGQMTKTLCPVGTVCDSGTYYCQGQCGACCYKGIGINPKYSPCD